MIDRDQTAVDAAREIESLLRPDSNCPARAEGHIPMKAALDDAIGCIRCGQWIGRQQ